MGDMIAFPWPILQPSSLEAGQSCEEFASSVARFLFLWPLPSTAPPVLWEDEGWQGGHQHSLLCFLSL